MNVNAKYLKDGDNNIISPVTSANTVKDNKTLILQMVCIHRSILKDCLVYISK